MSKIQSSQALAAQAIRVELKAAFPGIKFKVTSQGFSMGDSVSVSYTDGPAVKKVEEITGKYVYGHFDGMNDYYENSNRRDDIPQTKYLHVNRHLSPEAEAKWAAVIRKSWGIAETVGINEYLKPADYPNIGNSFNTIGQAIWREFQNVDTRDNGRECDQCHTVVYGGAEKLTLQPDDQVFCEPCDWRVKYEARKKAEAVAQ